MSVNVNSGISAQLNNLAVLLCAKASITGPTVGQVSIGASAWFITQALTVILSL